MKNILTIFYRKNRLGEAGRRSYLEIYAKNLRTGPARCTLAELYELAAEYREEIANPEDVRPHKIRFNKDCYKIVLAEIKARAALRA